MPGRDDGRVITSVEGKTERFRRGLAGGGGSVAMEDGGGNDTPAGRGGGREDRPAGCGGGPCRCRGWGEGQEYERR